MLADQFGRVIKEIRTEKGLSQESLGFKSGLDRTYIWRIEAGRRTPSVEVLFSLANGLDVKASEIIKKLEDTISSLNP